MRGKGSVAVVIATTMSIAVMTANADSRTPDIGIG